MKRILFIALVASFLITSEVSAGIGDVQRIDTVKVDVEGTDANARFVPAVVEIQPGDVIQFVVREGLHTVSAYHLENRRPQRIPKTAQSFDSGLLKAGDTWFLRIKAEGVYDYFCLPHERMGHVGRILSGSVPSIPDYPKGQIPEAALKKLNAETTSFFTKQTNLKEEITMKSLTKITLIAIFMLAGTISTALAQRTIDIVGTDNMKFSVTSIEAEAGEEITIKLTTKSQIPKTAMAHNVVVIDNEADVDEVASASMQARDNDYIAPKYKDQIIAATGLAGGGETVEVTFTVPEKPGDYQYICSFPGHFQAGMKGVLKVRSSAS